MPDEEQPTPQLLWRHASAAAERLAPGGQQGLTGLSRGEAEGHSGILAGIESLAARAEREGAHAIEPELPAWRERVQAAAGPEAWRVQRAFGEALTAMDRESEAVWFLRAAHTAQPDDARTAAALAVCFTRTGRFEEAIHLAETALTDEPYADTGAFVRAWCLFCLGRYEEAEHLVRPLAQRPVPLSGAAPLLAKILGMTGRGHHKE